MDGRLSAVLLVALLASGCAGPPSPDVGSVAPEPGEDPAAAGSRPVESDVHRDRDANTQDPGHEPLRAPLALSSNMTLRYVGANGTSVTIRIRAADVMDAYGAVVAGHVVSLRSAQDRVWHFGLGACRTPLWVQAGDGTVWFLRGGHGRYFDALPGFLILPSGTLGQAPARRSVADGMSEFPVPGSPYLVAAGLDGRGLVTKWVHDWPGPPAQKIVDSMWTTEAVAAGGVPSWIEPPTWTWFREPQPRFHLDRSSVVTSGPPLAACDAFAADSPTFPTQALTRRATKADPPLAWSLNEMADYAEQDTSLASLQEWKDAPGVVVQEWWGMRVRSYGPLAPDNWSDTYRWSLMYADPAAGQALYVICERLVEPAIPVPAATTECREAPMARDSLRPMAPLDVDSVRLVDYAHAFGVYRELFGKDACDMRLTFNNVWQAPFDYEFTSPALVLSCEIDDAELVLDPVEGHLWGIGAPTPWFRQPAL